MVAVADSDSELAAHAAASTVTPVIRQVRRVVGLINVPRLGDDAPPVARQPVEAPQEPLRLRRAREEAEVVPEHDDRVEDAERLVDVVDRAQAHVAHSAPAADLHGSGRIVDADDLLAARLEMEADPAAAAADVEGATADEAHRLPIERVPPPEGREIGPRPRIRLDEAVVALHDLARLPTVEGGQEHLSVAVLALLHDISDATVGSPLRRGGRSSRQVHSFGSLSSRKRRKRVPCRSRLPCTLS
jgi:hypothetical protein